MTKKTGEFKVKFRGVRGSYPVCASNQVKYGGNTSCVEVSINGRLIVIDGGTGIINLGGDLVRDYIASGASSESRKPIEAVLLFSHSHLDHIQGFPFFKPAYIKNSNIYMYGFRPRNKDFEQVLAETIFDPIFPIELKEMSANIFINNLLETHALIIYPDKAEPEKVKLNDECEIQIPEDAILIKCSKSYAHPKDGVLNFRISCNGKSMVYASDKESYIGGDSKFTTFARNADLLIHDAQYTMEDYVSPIIPKQGYGHSTPDMAIEAAKLANVKQLILFHLDPNYNDDFLDKMEKKAKGLFNNLLMAYEGLEVDLMQTANR
ncbi:MAG TPA: MBL fold metallo-hydrolase [Candidatus Gastranaerophilales bacterium]|nr:MBL fold metallo-hydrolase [Candidatus Gastranaerophilales bacterium]